MVADHLAHDEAEERLGERRVEPGLDREGAQPGDLLVLARRVGRRQPDGGLVPAHRLGDLEPLGKQVDQRGVDVVDAGPVGGEDLVRRPRSGVMAASP